MSTQAKSRRSAKQPRTIAREWQPRRAVVRGQDSTRWRDIYHAIIRAPWWVFVAGTATVYALINAVFALVYMLHPGDIGQARDFWDYFLFSVQTIGSANYTTFGPRTDYGKVIVSVEAFVGILNLAVIAGVAFARFSRPYARVVFSQVAVIVPFNGVPTMMFRAANQRGNQILDASVSVSLARQVTTMEGIVMRRFEELKLVRARTPLFGLSWTVMHQIDKSSPLHGATVEALHDAQVEIIVLLSGTDDALATTIYARHSYMPDEILWNRRFVDVLELTPSGRRLVDLRHFHETEPLPE